MDKFSHKSFNRNNLPSPLAVLERLGIKVSQPNRGGYYVITCPIHAGGNEKNPSLNVHNVEGNFLCYACHAKGGDIIDLWQLFTQEDFKQSVRSLGCCESSEPRHVISHSLPFLERMLEKGEAVLKEKKHKARLLEQAVNRHKRLAKPAPSTHGYLMLKGIKLQNLKVVDGYLIIPMYTKMLELVSYQRIWPDRTKKVLANTPVSGLYGLVGVFDKNKPIIICEGFSKAYAIWASLGIACFISFGHGNLSNALKTILMNFEHNGQVIIAADKDLDESSLISARKALESLNIYQLESACIIRPENVGEDYNDVFLSQGSEALAALFNEVLV